MRLCWPGPAAPRLTSGSPWGVVWPERWPCRPGPQSQTHRPGRGPRASQGLVLTPHPANTSITQGPGPGAAPLLQTHLRRHRQTEPRAGMREHHPASLALLGWGQGCPAAHGASSSVTAKLPTLPPALSPGTSPPHPPQRWGADTAGRRFLPPRGPPSPFSAQGLSAWKDHCPTPAPLLGTPPPCSLWPLGPAWSRASLPSRDGHLGPPRPGSGSPCPLSAPLPLQAPTPCRGPCSLRAGPRPCFPVVTSGWGVWWAESRHVPQAHRPRIEVSTQVQSTPGLCLSTRGSSAPCCPQGQAASSSGSYELVCLGGAQSDLHPSDAEAGGPLECGQDASR